MKERGDSKEMNERTYIGCCGLYCKTCDIFIAHNTGDLRKKKEIADVLGRQTGEKVRLRHIVCEGCKGEEALCWGIDCPLRSCCLKRGHEFCFECTEYPCAELESFLMHPMAERARYNLEQIQKKGLSIWLREIKQS